MFARRRVGGGERNRSSGWLQQSYIKSLLLVYSTPESFVTVASFRIWRGWQNIVAKGPTRGEGDSN